MKKTFNVEQFKEKINDKLENDKLTQADKSILCIVLEDVLHETGNYKGFGYLNSGLDPEKEYSRVYH